MIDLTGKLQGRLLDYHPDLEQLEEIIEEHRKWIISEGIEGEKANLSNLNLEEVDFEGANLQDADLQGANLQDTNLKGIILQGANLQGANLRGADLFGANLQKAGLQKTKLQGADLREADLREAWLQKADLQDTNFAAANLCKANLSEASLLRANLTAANLQDTLLLRAILREAVLQDADLTGAKGLLGGEVAGANVSGAKLPEMIRKFEGLKIVEEACKNARKIFVSMLLGCVYSWLTITTTTDARLLTNAASSPLPIIGTEIPIVGFYWATPLVLIGIYMYFHLNLQHLWGMLANLPALFPDGRPLDERVYPWLLNRIVRAHFFLLKDKRPPLSHLQVVISILLAWWVVPATLVLFWGRYLPRHDWIGSILHILLLVASIEFGRISYLLAKTTLRGEKRESLFQKEYLKKMRIFKYAAVSFLIGSIFYFFSLGAINGIPPNLYKDNLAWSPPPRLSESNPRRWVPLVLALIGCSPFANLEEVDLSNKPPNWTGRKEKVDEEIALVKGANLEGRNLRYASAFRVFLVNADLRKTNFWGAYLAEADLRKAKMEETVLCHAFLAGADLREVYLSGANLKKTDLRRVDLRGAVLSGIRNWEEICNMELANIYGVKDPPAGFIEWATTKMNAVSLSSDEEWEASCKIKANFINDLCTYECGFAFGGFN